MKTIKKALVIIGAISVFTFTSLYVVNSFAAQAEKSCTITVRDNSTGKSYTITVHGTSCAELIKQVLQQ